MTPAPASRSTGGEPAAPAMTTAAPTVPTLRSLVAPVYLPTLIFAVGQGAVVPVVALAARDVGASVAVAGVAVALRGIGTMAFDVPAGKLVARVGERRAMLVATVTLVVALLGCIASPSPAPFAASMFLMGCGWSVWLLARLTYVSDVMPTHLRGRALSTLGGVQRVGGFVGPFLGAVAVTAIGLDGAYHVHIALAVVGWVVLRVVPEPVASTPPSGHAPVRVGAIVGAHRSTFLTAGAGALAIGALRASRQVVLPLWADAIGLDAAQVSVVFGCSAALDMTLFYPAGLVSDRWGRKAVAVPCLTLMAVGLLLVPLTSSFSSLVAVGLVLGFGNGLGSGIVMTLGSDFAPPVGRAEFLGVWRLVGDVGTAGGPLLVAAVEAAASLATATAAVGVVGLAGAAVVLLRVPEPLRGDDAGRGVRARPVLPDPGEEAT